MRLEGAEHGHEKGEEIPRRRKKKATIDGKAWGIESESSSGCEAPAGISIEELLTGEGDPESRKPVRVKVEQDEREAAMAWNSGCRSSPSTHRPTLEALTAVTSLVVNPAAAAAEEAATRFSAFTTVMRRDAGARR